MSIGVAIRELDESVANRLERQAARHARSVDAELLEGLRGALMPLPDPNFEERAAELRARTASRIDVPSEVLLRQSRDER